MLDKKVQWQLLQERAMNIASRVAKSSQSYFVARRMESPNEEKWYQNWQEALELEKRVIESVSQEHGEEVSRKFAFEVHLEVVNILEKDHEFVQEMQKLWAANEDIRLEQEEDAIRDEVYEGAIEMAELVHEKVRKYLAELPMSTVVPTHQIMAHAEIETAHNLSEDYKSYVVSAYGDDWGNEYSRWVDEHLEHLDHTYGLAQTSEILDDNIMKWLEEGGIEDKPSDMDLKLASESEQDDDTQS